MVIYMIGGIIPADYRLTEVVEVSIGQDALSKELLPQESR